MTEHRELEDAAREAFRGKWPEFIFHDRVSLELLPLVERLFPRFDVLLRDGAAVLAGSWAVPFAWDGTLEDLPDGYDGALRRSVDEYDSGVRPNTLCVMAAAVADVATARGLAAEVLGGLKSRAAESSLEHLVVPVRPTLKHRYPLTPMTEYATWRREDAQALDPWIRTHERMGAAVLGVAPRSMTIEGTVAEWESWAGMAFPATGDYVVPQALSPVRIDRTADRGVYVEDNLWMQHPMAAVPG